MSETITISVEEWARLNAISTAALAAVKTYDDNKEFIGAAGMSALMESIRKAAK
jgi:hypothetical protein